MSPIRVVNHDHVVQKTRSCKKALPAPGSSAGSAVVVKPARESIRLSNYANGDFRVLTRASLDDSEGLMLLQSVPRARKRLMHRFGNRRCSLMRSTINSVRSSQLLDVGAAGASLRLKNPTRAPFSTMWNTALKCNIPIRLT